MTVQTLSILAANALAASIWQGVLLACAVAICLRLLPGITAAARSMIWTAVFAVVLLLHFTPAAHHTLSQAAPIQLNPRWSLALAALWLALSLFRAGQLVLSATRLRQVARRATPVSEPPHQIGRRSFTLCVSPDVDRPSVAGFFTPRILLPPALYATLTPTELRHVLLHETEHLRRADDWTNLLQKAALVLFPLNPVLLWVERRLCLERELACDDRVLAETGAPKAYATCLAALAEHSLLRRGISLALGFLGTGTFSRQSELSQRVHRILRTPHEAFGARTAASLTGVVLLALGGGGYQLAHSPQLISFNPVATFSANQAAPVFSSTQFPRATFQNATFHVPETHAGPALALAPTTKRPAKSRKVVRLKRPINPTPRLLKTEWHNLSYATASRFVLTADDATQAQYTLVPAVLHVPAYAAVATPNGWLIIQL